MTEKTTSKMMIDEYRKPMVLKYKRGDTAIVSVIYRNRVETYEMTEKHTKSQIEAERKKDNAVGIDGSMEWSKYQEKHFLKENGWKSIHYQEAD